MGESFLRGILRYIKPVPSGIIYDTDLDKNGFPWLTSSLVLLNSIIFFTVSERLLKAGIFPPIGDPSTFHVIISVFTSTFLHADFTHLLFNMIFLWTFGSVLEPRVGALHFITVYVLAIVVSHVVCIVMLNVQSDYLNSADLLGEFHSLGASGAISGIIGLFAVRCFYARVKVSFPVFIFPFISTSLILQGTIIIGIYFAMDIAGSVKQFEINSPPINYWAHVGGYFAGFFMGYILKLYKPALAEALSVKAERLKESSTNKENATKLYNDILKQDPSNEAALKYFFSLNQYNPLKAEPYYVRIIQVLIKKDFPRSLELFKEHYPNFINALPGDALLQFGLYYYKNADLEKARPCLELASDKVGPWQAKAMLTLGMTFEGLGNKLYAKDIFKNVMKRYPDSVFHVEAKTMISKLL